MLTPAEYRTLCQGPEGLAEPVSFESLVERGCLVVRMVEPGTGHRFTDITPLGYLAKRVYEAIWMGVTAS